MRAGWCENGEDRSWQGHCMSAAQGHGQGTCGNDRHAEAHGHAWDKDLGMDTEGHTDTDSAHTGTHRHRTLGYRCSGTVHIGGCTQRHAWKHGHGPGTCREMWPQVQCHCAHTRDAQARTGTHRWGDTVDGQTGTHMAQVGTRHWLAQPGQSAGDVQ